MDTKNIGDYGKSTKGVEYWVGNRKKFADLYPSEAYFFKDFVVDKKCLLDVGCAAGSTFLITQELNKTLDYHGIDISKPLIEAAQQRFGKNRFTHYNGGVLPFLDNQFDGAFSLGVLHHTPDWQSLVKELLRVSLREILFDLRCHYLDDLVDPTVSFQKLALNEEWDGVSKVPYQILSLNRVLSFLESLVAGSGSVSAYGYWGAPTKFAVTPISKVLMVSFLVRKEKQDVESEVKVEIKG